MQNTRSNYFVCDLIFNIFATLFKIFEIQNDDKNIFVSRSFRTRLYAKRWFSKDVVRRVQRALQQTHSQQHKYSRKNIIFSFSF